MLSTYLQAFFRKSRIPMAEVARQSGVSIPTISRMRSGEISNPQWLTVVALFRAIGGSLDAAADITASDLPQLFVLEQKNASLEERLTDTRAQLDLERSYRAEDRAAYQKENHFIRRVALYLIVALVLMSYLFVDSRNADWGIFQTNTINSHAFLWLLLAVAVGVGLFEMLSRRK